MGNSSIPLPPQDIEIERSVLASLIFCNDTEVFDFIRPDHFYRTGHRKIFEACRSVYKKEHTLDIKLITSELGVAISEVGGMAYFGELSLEPTPPNTEVYCKKLISLYKLRRLIEISNATNKRAYSTTDDAETVIDYVSGELARISDGRGGGWCSMQDVMITCVDHCEEIKKQQGVTGVPTGFSQIDLYTAGLQKGDLVILAARPGCGKTAFVINASKNAGVKGFKNGFQSLEMDRVPIGNRFLSVVSRVNSLKFRSGRFVTEDWDNIAKAAERLSQLPIWIDDSPRASFQEIQKNARALHAKHGLDVLWIDYLGFVDGDKTNRSKVAEIESITRGMKALAKELCIPVVLLSQLNRECEKRENKRPQLSDLRDSGAIEQDADVVIFLYRDEKYNKDTADKGIVEVEIAKQRNGPTARVKLKWTDEFMRFDNLEREPG